MNACTKKIRQAKCDNSGNHNPDNNIHTVKYEQENTKF